jgi:hypothetical protein
MCNNPDMNLNGPARAAVAAGVAAVVFLGAGAVVMAASDDGGGSSPTTTTEAVQPVSTEVPTTVPATTAAPPVTEAPTTVPVTTPPVEAPAPQAGQEVVPVQGPTGPVYPDGYSTPTPTDTQPPVTLPRAG